VAVLRRGEYRVVLAINGLPTAENAWPLLEVVTEEFARLFLECSEGLRVNRYEKGPVLRNYLIC